MFQLLFLHLPLSQHLLFHSVLSIELLGHAVKHLLFSLFLHLVVELLLLGHVYLGLLDLPCLLLPIGPKLRLLLLLPDFVLLHTQLLPQGMQLLLLVVFHGPLFLHRLE